MYKEQILEQTTEADIFGHYVPDFKGTPGSFINPLKPGEKHPSLSIFPHRDGSGKFLFSAKNTGHEGDAFQLVADLKNLDSKSDFPAIAAAIAHDMNLTLPAPASAAREKTWEVTAFPAFTPDFIAYWAQWDVTPELLTRYGVQQAETCIYDGKTYHHHNRQAALFTGAGRRKIKVPSTPEKPKSDTYKEPTGPAYLFGLEQVPEGAETLIICEGEKDVLALAAKGFFAVTAGSATDTPTTRQTEQISGAASRVFICLDTDDAGRKGAARIAGKTGFPVIELPPMGKNAKGEERKDITDFFEVGHSAENFAALVERVRKEAGEKKKSGDIGPATDGSRAGEQPAAGKIQDEKTPEGSAKGGEPTPAAAVRVLYELLKDKEGNVTGIKPKANKTLELISSWGFGRYDVAPNEYQLIHRKENVIRPVSHVEIADAFFKWLRAAPETIEGYPLEKILNKFLDGQHTYFSENRLWRLNAEPLKFCTDTRKETFFFFKNGFVKCTAQNWSLQAYSALEGCIWEEQIIPREIEISGPMPEGDEYARGVIAQFLFNICGKKPGRFLEFSTVVGYALHGYFEGKRFAVLLTDSNIESGDQGRTGKGRIISFLEAMKPTATIAGKSFDPENKFRYQQADRATQIIVIDDLRKNFHFEALYNDITEGLNIEKKNQKPFPINAKILLTTNSPIRIDGASGRDRVKEIELYPHYSDTFSPFDEFKKTFLSTNEEQFSAQDWNQFYNLMFYCAHAYLDLGVLQPEEINLSRRKLINQTFEGFPDWMDDQIGQGKIKNDAFFDCWTLYDDFMKAFPDFDAGRQQSQRKRFKQWLIDYANLTPTIETHRRGVDDIRRDTTHLFRFIFKEKQA